MAVGPADAALEAVAVAASFTGGPAGCPPPCPPDTASGTVQEELKMPGSVSTSLTVSPVLLAIADTLSP